MQPEIKTPTIFKALFNGVNTSASIKQYKLTLIVDETQREELLNMALKYPIGSPLLILAYDGSADSLTSFNEETQEQTKKRFQKQMFAKITELVETTGKNKEEIVTDLKEYLVRNDYMKTVEDSSKNLDIRGLNFAINYLKTKKYEKN
ncbi:hypothetical protein [Methanoculleus sp.]|uniref:hypothetical protein n=1 Tax=Methanoculleus sp. TaxID=90427 RepID=UPI0025D41BA6|nr:hypothetical protein [Methanoculleus sp.]MCK9319816.1 hypothetical protein [Methanoculleus sp.]